MSDFGDMRPPDDGGVGIADESEEKVFSKHEEALNKVIIHSLWQRNILRWVAGSIALIVIVAAGYLEYRMLCYVVTWGHSLNDLFIILAVAPIVSITLIVVFVLIAVFRGFGDKDLVDAPAKHAGQALLSNGQ